MVNKTETRFYGDKLQVVREETDDEDALQAIDSTITDRHVAGKFRGLVVMHGTQLTDASYNKTGGSDYRVLPGNYLPYRYRDSIDPSRRLAAFIESCYYDANIDNNGYGPQSRVFKEHRFSDSLNIALLRDVTDANTTHIFIQAPNKDKDEKTRLTYFCHLNCQLPATQVTNLLELIRKDSKNAERFIQIAFAGIDNATWRIPVNHGWVVDIDQLIPKSILTNNIVPGAVHDSTSTYAKNNLLNITAITAFNYPTELPALE